MTKNISSSDIESLCSSVFAENLSHIRYITLFIGHAHSGHSIIGSILDMHERAAIANEVNIAKLIRDFNLNKNQIESILLHYSFQNITLEAWENSEYQYKKDKSFQGKTSYPFVLGDKKAGGTTRILRNYPWVLKHLLSIYGSKIKFIFVERNPIDIVAAYSYYMKQSPSQFHVDRYLENLETVKTIKNELNSTQFFHISHHEFKHNPVDVMKSLFDFLQLDIDVIKIRDWTRHVRSDIPGKSSIIKLPTALKTQIE